MNITRNGNGTTQACAACKYQRRKCAPDCILAPYFPHDRQRQFLNAHKLFGVSNITKIIKNLNQPEKDEAMRTIIFQSDVRANDPVGGCYRIIRELQRQIEYNKAELDIVLHQLAICRAQTQAQQQQQHVPMPHQVSDNASINCDNNIINADPLSSYNPMQYHYLQPQPPPPPPPPPHQEQYIVNDLQEDVSTWTVQDSVSSSLSSLQIKNNNGTDQCEDIKPIFEIPCDRNELKFVSEEEIVERSDEALLKIDNAILKEDDGSIQQAQDHDLKGAATLFTLTNYNS